MRIVVSETVCAGDRPERIGVDRSPLGGSRIARILRFVPARNIFARGLS